MKRKSKLATFMLSFIPGISHFYLGYGDRGLIYLLTFGFIGGGSLFLSILLHSEAPGILGLGAGCILWLVALVDAFSIHNQLRYSGEEEVKKGWESEETREENKKIITLALSIVPGAGHMYLGYQKKGLTLMGMFFFTIFFMGWLNLSFLLFLLPLIWFYSFFDAFHTINGSKQEEVNLYNLLPSIKQEHIGWGLIILGIIVGLQKIFIPIGVEILDSIFGSRLVYQLGNYIQTGLVAFILIFVGMKMLRKRKDIELIEIEGVVEDEE